MRRLMLLRHAKTEHDAPSGQDQDRRLDDRGRLDAAAIGDWIGRHPPLPDAVLVSTAVRAQQTWEIAGQAMKDAIREQAASPPGKWQTEWQAEFLADIYGAEPAQLLQIIRMAEVTSPGHLLVVGHNPGMHELALALTGDWRHVGGGVSGMTGGHFPSLSAYAGAKAAGVTMYFTGTRHFFH